MSNLVPDASRDERGFTLVELLTAITIGLIVLLAGYAALDSFSAGATHQSRVTDANDQVRRTMDNTVRDLRGSSVILRAQAADLVYAVPATSTTTKVNRVCVASNVLRGSSDDDDATPTVPGAACSSLPSIATLANGATTAFSYDGASSSATPATVKNVGLTFGLLATTGSKTSTSTLRASAARRSAGTLPITDDDLIVKCQPTGGALLSLGVGLPGSGTLSVLYTDDDGISLGTPNGTQLTIPSTVTRVLAIVTDSLGVTNTIEKDITCET